MRRAAHDASQDDDVRGLDVSGVLEQVGEHERRAVGDARRLRELGCGACIASDDLDDPPAAAPRRTSSAWIWPIPPPTSTTVALVEPALLRPRTITLASFAAEPVAAGSAVARGGRPSR